MKKVITRKEDFDIMVSRPFLIKGPEWFSFLDKHVFLLVSGEVEQEAKTEDDTPEDTAGRPLDDLLRGSEDEEDSETEDDDTKENGKNEETEKESAYEKWNRTLTEAMLMFREKTGGRLARVHKRQIKVNGTNKRVCRCLLMIEKTYADAFKDILLDAGLESGQSYCIREVRADRQGVDIDEADIINLMAVHMLYIYADKKKRPVPTDRLIPEYQIFFKGNARVNYLSGLQGKNSEKVKDAKNSFLALYAKPDDMTGKRLFMKDVRPYYEDGEWVKCIKSDKKRAKVIKRMRYELHDIADDFVILTEGKKGYLGSYSSYRMKEKSLMPVISTSTNESELTMHEKTKRYQILRMQNMFNQIYNNIARLSFETWNCHDTSVNALQNDPECVRSASEDKIQKINRIRERIGRKGLNVWLDSGNIDADGTFRNTFSECVSCAIFVGKYSGKVACPDDGLEIDADCLETHGLDIRFARLLYSYTKKNEKGKDETHNEVIHAEKSFSSFYFDFTENMPACFTIKKIFIGVTGRFDFSLQNNYKCRFYFNDEKHCMKIQYWKGFGIEDANVLDFTSGISASRLNVHVIPDRSRKLKAYEDTKCLAVQHFTIDGDMYDYKEDKEEKGKLVRHMKKGVKKYLFSKDLPDKCQKLIEELYIRSIIIDDEIPKECNADEALYAAHIPKCGKRGSFKVYYLYQRDGNERIMQISESEALARFPGLTDLDKYGDRYALRIGGQRYYIRNSSMVPLGKPMLDEDGNILPLKTIASKSKENWMSYIGYIGITTYQHMDDHCLYYMAGEYNMLNQIQGKISKFTNIYRVTGDTDKYGVPQSVDAEAFKSTFSNSMVRINGVTVIPVIFKYMREWALKAGRILPKN